MAASSHLRTTSSVSTAQGGAGRAGRKALSPTWLRFAQQVVDSAGVLDDATAETIVRAFAAIHRDKFLDEGYRGRATEDVALPTGFGQPSTKPSTVARMLALIGLHKGMRVLEVGCGSGYTAAVIAAAGAQVYALESVGLLAQQTRRLLDSLSYSNILVRRGDGERGWQEYAPFDAIVVSNPIERMEPELLAQLAPNGGRMVAPVGKAASLESSNSNGQILSLWEAKEGSVAMYQLEPCSFVEVL